MLSRRFTAIYILVILLGMACVRSVPVPPTATVPPASQTPPPSLTPIPSETPLPTDTPTAAPTATETPLPTPTANLDFDISRSGTVDRDVTYCTAAGRQLKMDVYYPDSASRLWPAVVVIHGGTWMSGDKSSGIATRFIEPLRQADYLVVSINYRLAPEFKFPDQIEDVKCAIRHLRANAAEYNLDDEHIAALGFSAGGHLAALAGLSDSNQFNNIGGYKGVTSSLQAVVDISGPTNLRMYCEPSTVRQVFGAVDCDDVEALDPADPGKYVTPGDPPVLMVHGNQDNAAPLGYSTYLQQQLEQANVFNVLLEVEGAGHSYDLSGRQISPDFPQIIEFVLQFLEVTLRQPPE